MNQIRTWLYWLISALILSGVNDVFAKFQNTSVNAAILVNSQRTERHAEYYLLKLGILTEYSDLCSPISFLRTYAWGLDLSGNHPVWVIDGEEHKNRSEARDVPIIECDASINGRWVEARSLQVGDILLSQLGHDVVVTRTDSRIATVQVYNIQVQQDHTYAITKKAILVHNKSAQIKPVSTIESGELAAARGMGFESIEAYKQAWANGVVQERTTTIFTQLGRSAGFGETYGVAVVLDQSGNMSVVVSSASKYGLGKVNGNLLPGEQFIGRGITETHAEIKILNWANQNNLSISAIGATRPVCVPCQSILDPAGIIIMTLRKP